MLTAILCLISIALGCGTRKRGERLATFTPSAEVNADTLSAAAIDTRGRELQGVLKQLELAPGVDPYEVLIALRNPHNLQFVTVDPDEEPTELADPEDDDLDDADASKKKRKKQSKPAPKKSSKPADAAEPAPPAEEDPNADETPNPAEAEPA
jgi:hypothetical protein